MVTLILQYYTMHVTRQAVGSGVTMGIPPGPAFSLVPSGLVPWSLPACHLPCPLPPPPPLLPASFCPYPCQITSLSVNYYSNMGHGHHAQLTDSTK